MYFLNYTAMPSSSMFRKLGLASLALFGVVNSATLSISTTGGNASSPLLCGLMFEVRYALSTSRPY